MIALRVLVSIVYWICAFAVTVVFFAICTTFALALYPFDKTRRAAQLFSTIYNVVLFRLNPQWRLRVLGRERYGRGPYVICPNHQSFVDIFALGALHGQWRWVAKRSLLRTPFLGWAMWAVGNIGLVRGDKASGERMLGECRRWLGWGVSVVIFPEGTRSRDGELLPFKHGAFTLAIATGTSVLPIAIDGSRDALRKGGFDVTARSDVVVSVLDPIDAAPFVATNDVEGLKAATRAAIAAEIARLRSERAATGTSPPR
jgi:1-acyl-sn-glycerol-3-phosphate acyltransferase